MSIPETFVFDMTGDNGTPFRFIYWPSTKSVVYYDRRYPTRPDELAYRPFFNDENGQHCGPYLEESSFTGDRKYGIRGWHEVDAWDIDRRTVIMVGDWIEMIKEKHGL